MKKKRAANRLIATLRGRWWREQLKQIRHCFRCGGRLERRYVRMEGRQRYVCSGCTTITYTNPKVVAGCIPVLWDGRVALLRRDIEPARGKWSYPAGYVELGESVLTAAIRETREEIGVNVKIIRELGVYSYANAGVVTVVYEGRVLRGQTPRPGKEARDVKTFLPSKVPWKRLAFRSTVDALKDWIRRFG